MTYTDFIMFTLYSIAMVAGGFYLGVVLHDEIFKKAKNPKEDQK